MKKFILLLVLVFVAGNSAAVTVITTPEELQAMGDDLAGDYILGNDIDMTGIPWQAIAYRDSGVDFVFTGTLDGNFNVIKNFTGIDDLSDAPFKTASLIGILGEGGVIKNLGMTDVNITMDGTQGTPNYVGAMVSDNKGEMSKCWLEGGTISVTGATAGNNSGSLVGALRGTGSITDCYVLGVSVTINGMNGTGGFVNQSGGGTIENCYVAGAVDLTPRDETLAAGFARDSSGTGADITSCYYNMDITTFMGVAPWDDLSGMGRTTAQMMTQANYVGWDFENTWTMVEGLTYPAFFPVVGAAGPDPPNGKTIPVNENLVLGWGLVPGPDSDDVYVEVWFGTEPNELDLVNYDMEPLVLIPVSGLNTTSYDSVDVSEEDTYYWRINSWVDDKLDDANMITGSLWRFYTAYDVAPSVEIVTLDQMTWTGEGALLDATVDDDYISDLTIEWSADLPAGISASIDPNDEADTTVTLTKVPYSEADIINAGFENPVLVDGEYSHSIVGWGWSETDYRETTNPYPPDGDLWGDPPNLFPAFGGIAPEGQNLAQTGNGGIAQVLTETLAADTTYMLTVEVCRAGFTTTLWDSYRVQLLAGGTPGDTGEITVGTILAEDANSVAIALDTYETVTVILLPNDFDPNLLGQPLQIRLLTGPDLTAEPIYFDDVHLTADPPFPAPTGVQTVTMTVTVSDLGNPAEPDTDSIEIEVYDDACHVARVGLGTIVEADLNANCITGLEDLKEVLAAWLDDYSAKGPEDTSVVVPVPAELIDVPNGSFEEIYKPGSTTITADLGNGWTTGVGPDTPMNPGQTVDYSDGTTGTVVDIPGWINAPAPWDVPPYTWTQGSGSIAAQRDDVPDGDYYFTANGSAWGNTPGGAIESDAPLGQVIGGATYTLSMFVNGPVVPVVLDLLADDVVLTPSSTVDPDPPHAWDVFSRTYDALDLVSHIGESLRIRVGWGPTDPDDDTQDQSHLDRVTLEIDHLLSPSPYHGETVRADESLELSWTNLDALTHDSNDVWVDVWFGTEPNELLDYDMILVVDAEKNTEFVIVDANAVDTYYWQVNTYINGEGNLNIENMVEGHLFLFHTSDDLAPAVEIVIGNQRTWSTEGVSIDATVTDDDESDMTIVWAADAASLADPNLTIDIVPHVDPENPGATVTITKTVDAGDVVTVTMTVTVGDVANPTSDTASIKIQVYNDDCHMARIGQGKSAVTDFNDNCITDLEDLAEMAAAWFDDYAAPGSVDR